MEILNEQFLRFLNNVYSTEYIKKETFDNFNKYFNNFQEFKNIPFNFDNQLKQYPFYPKDFKINPLLYVKKGYNFNTKKIMDSFNPIGDDRLQYMENLRLIINRVNKIPNKIDDILFTNLTQKLIISNNYFDNYFIEFINVDEQNSFFNLLGNKPFQNYHSSYNNLNLLHIITLYFALHRLFRNFYNINSHIISYFFNLNDQIFTKQRIIKEFNDFIFNKDQLFQKKEIEILTKFILKNIFSVISPSNNINLNVKEFINEKQLSLLSNAFDNFLTNNYSKNFLNIFSFKTLNVYKNLLFYHIFNNFINTDINNYIFKPFSDELNFKFSNEETYKFLLNINQYDLIDYLLPIYNYSLHPIKFINIVNYFTEKFVDDKIITDNVFEELFNKNNINNNINNVYKNLTNVTELLSFFQNINVKQISIENNLSGIISFYFYKELIVNFINSNEFRDWVILFLENVNKHLYGIKIIPYNYNWFNHIELVKSYFKIFFLKYSMLYKDNTFKNCLFPSFQNYFNDFLDNNTATFNATNEILKSNIQFLENDSNNLKNISLLIKNIYKGYLNKKLNNIVLSNYLIK